MRLRQVGLSRNFLLPNLPAGGATRLFPGQRHFDRELFEHFRCFCGRLFKDCSTANQISRQRKAKYFQMSGPEILLPDRQAFCGEPGARVPDKVIAGLFFGSGWTTGCFHRLCVWQDRRELHKLPGFVETVCCLPRNNPGDTPWPIVDRLNEFQQAMHLMSPQELQNSFLP